MRSVFLSITILFISFSNAFTQDVESLAKTFGSLPEISSIEISPDGTKVIMLQNYQGKKILVTKSLVDPDIPQNGIPYPGGDINWAKWTDNEHILVGVSFDDVVNLSPYNSYIYNVDARLTKLVAMRWDGEEPVNPVPLVDRKFQPQFQASIVDFLVDDPDHVLIEIDVDKINVRGVHKLNIKRKAKRYQKVVKGRSYIDYWKTDINHVVRFGAGTSNIYGKNKIRSVAYFRNSEESNWYRLYDIDLNQEDVPFEFVAFTQDPSVIYALMPSENGKRALFKYDVERQITIEKISQNDEHDVVYVDVNDRGVPEWYLYNAEKQEIVYLNDEGKQIDAILSKTFPDQNVWISSKTADGQKIIFKVSTPQDPGTYYMLDMNLKKIIMVGYNYQNVDIEKLSEMKPITYEARDGLEIPGYLSLPVGIDHKNLPTIIFPHWGPDHRDVWGFDYNVQYLTSLGYAVLQMNYRGSTGYGIDYANLGDHQWGDKILDDINDGTKWMIEQGYSNPNNICIMGDTYGGYAALQSIVKEPSMYKCSIAHAPITVKGGVKSSHMAA